MQWIFALALGYALGSVPFGLIITRIAGAGDLRSIGSGNIGATNVLRTGRKGLAAATLLLDLLKGLAAVLIAAALWPASVWLAALGAFLGHCFPVWLKFRGGKGVATTAGIAFGLAWPVGLAYALTWIGLLLTVKISSVAGMTAAVVAPLVALALGHQDAALVLAVIAAIVLFQHRENIARLRAGTEPRVGGSKKS
ncbi:glycerol-3-phosphate 1-O-acyltransferase PlsY [Novosphingobium pentaromativorans]|uniref:Glycerol-3-phosphate acyltransferase n=1 Tax=Novosphingobium pentaromativorans US6-1 TaxID=1088721 RepID=G6EHW4_9SPHN|nr:glycerol-3-phosphate 1-O-acyltransferase PlsY [Novosphingobium pentaromativorans]AIT78606.1 glycerol-3-phosphate acyltransferase [Novosphingobium pentaromativorans US6-1]EHJ59098.1 acyl-phosphate glycerol-3-phosphate acyltransferase [Novosphingobium pentaromativorans US6-1]